MKLAGLLINREMKASFCVVFVIAIIYMLPFILFGTDSIVWLHDNLDFQLPFYKMYHDNGLFFTFDAPTTGFSEMSTLYYGSVNFSLISFIFYFFNDFFAYSLVSFLTFLLGFFSMYVLLKKTGFSIHPFISILVSVCFALLPTAPVLGMASNTWPLIIAVFLHFATKTKFSWKIVWVLFYPLISSFTMTGIFILGIWFICFIAHWIKNKRININLLTGFLLLCVGYILVDLRLFYVMFVLKTPLNRSIFIYSDETISQFKFFLIRLMKFCVNGYYHALSLQRLIIIPFASLLSIIFIHRLFRKSRKQKDLSRITTGWAKIDYQVKIILILELVIFIFYVIAALDDAGYLQSFIGKFIPMLRGFGWTRIWILNRVLWYLLFACCLQYIWGIKKDTFNIKIGRYVKKIKLPSSFFRLCVWFLLLFQLGYIMLNPVPYNDQVRTWFNELAVKTGIIQKITPNKTYDQYISYREFFSKELFETIKEDISYSDERVVAFGFHPSVLMYNGFNCIDGYNNSYPLSYMQTFRALIEPELEINKTARDYYYSWGGRMYLYNAEFDYEPTRNKITTPIKLNINMDVLRNDFRGKYIISSVVISNSDALCLRLINRYDHDESIYSIYLYAVN